MFEQIILILVLALNFIFIWLSFFYKKTGTYSSWGTFIWLAILVYLPLSEQPRFGLWWLKLLGFVIMLFGLIIFLKARGEFRKKKLRSRRVTKKLIVSGLYSKMRHPQYFGLMIFYAGLCLLFGALYAIYLIPAVIVLHVLQAWLEEKYILEKMFKQDYKKYKKKVGMFW